MSLSHVYSYYNNYNNVIYSKKFYKQEEYFIQKFSQYFKANENLDIQYKNLISNLDKNSINIIDKIIERIKIISKSDVFYPYSFFSENERKNIYKNYTKNNLLYFGSNKYNNIFFPQGFNFEIWTCIYKEGIIFLKNRNLKNKDIIDIGAFIGDSAIFIKKFTNGNIFCIEPDIKTFNLLNLTLALNNEKNIKCFNFAIADKVGKYKFASLGITSQLIFDSINDIENIYEVNVTTLDNFVNENNINPKIIKIDTEGAEKLVLQGAQDTLKKFKPIILVSIYHNPNDFFFIKKQINDMDLKYKFRIVKPDDGLVLRNTTLIAF